MNTRHLVHPELVPYLDALPRFDLSDETLPEIRRAEIPVLHAPAVANVTREEVRIAGRNGAPPVRVLVYRPTAAPEAGALLPAILHVHGGGYIIWNPEVDDARNRYLAGDLGCVVVSVDYRLAPETPFPGPLEDCYSGLLWLHENAKILGVDVARIALKGESAGGGLAAALALLARDRREVPVCFQHLTYPMLDDRTGAEGQPEANPYIGEFVWTAANNRFGWNAMRGTSPILPEMLPYLSPARATDLGGLPPTFLQVGGVDLFLDEILAYAQRLLRAGVSTELHVYPGAFHGFDMIPGSPIVATFERDAHAAMRRALDAL